MEKAINCIACIDTHQPAPGSLTPSGGQQALLISCAVRLLIGFISHKPPPHDGKQLSAPPSMPHINQHLAHRHRLAADREALLQSFAFRLMIGFISYRAIGAPLGNNP
jgi:hypothetical protein